MSRPSTPHAPTPVPSPPRRRFLASSGLALMGLAAAGAARAQNGPSPEAPAAGASAPQNGGDAGDTQPFSAREPLARILADPNRILKETVGLRPFRETGPNLGVETLGSKRLVHHYGHGGSGWSLSLGTAQEVVEKATATGERHYAVLGGGVIGLTTALALLHAGKRVRIYTDKLHPSVTSSMATGIWSPDSRICLEEHATPAFARWWEQTAERSFRAYQDKIGLPHRPVEWVDGYAVSDKPWKQRREEYEQRPGPKFGHFGEDIEDVVPQGWHVTPGSHPFGERYVRQGSRMIYNIPVCMQLMLEEIARLGGRIEIQRFESIEQVRALPERVIVNCTGLGAQKLFGDAQLVPVWGQLTFLIPQPEVRYQFSCEGAYIIPRQDGIVVGASDNGRYGATGLTPDRQQSLDALSAIDASMQRMRTA